MTQFEGLEGKVFTRAEAATICGVPVSEMNNWLGRHRFNKLDDGTKSMKISTIFDIALFAELRGQLIGGEQAAAAVRAVAPYQRASSQHLPKNVKCSWSGKRCALDDPNAILAVEINLGALASKVLSRIVAMGKNEK